MSRAVPSAPLRAPPAGVAAHARAASGEVRKTLLSAGRVRFDELPADTFKASKTSVRTVLVVFDKA